MDEVQEREKKEEFDASEIEYVSYGGEHHLPLIMNLVDQELSEPYSIFTYRYFVYLWPQLSFLASAFHKGKCVGTVVCKMGDHRNSTFRGYIAMLVVIKSYRGRGIATELVTRSIQVMMESGCEEVCRVLVAVPFGLYLFKCSIIHTTISQRKYGFFQFHLSLVLYIIVLNELKCCPKKPIIREALALLIFLVTLEAEVTNKGALALYGRLGFIRAKRLFHYYLNGVDAFRLKLLFPQPELHPSLPMMADRDDAQEHDDC
ncbi:hypothetical protein SADUNF_Sadunf16G0287000 [Salix dunnii]|uniref:N-acetyltransferase domain-containing protein n=1 Tax=Salix dunnii TaxID=1413687 RepID=A0A835MN22_9ROSI|nr:hypothetical protein SADUNF_Sadunf16G0287000 [Salix dunnii]